MSKQRDNKPAGMFDPQSFAQSFGDMNKLFEQFKVPGVDMSAIFDARRKDIEALVEANKATFEAMQAMASKQAELLTQTMKGLQDSARNAAASGPGAADAQKHAEVARAACQKALTDMLEIAGIARAAQADAAARINERFNAGLQEIRDMMQPKR
ncbi:hypothetical protein LMG28688_02721 [Paraburkholderia caffeinitolerans]|uniref:Phasin domain-containing protein n=1 Tax=Paraburkholderia caffeinitolerans TaxID=1723730 RepID=A0A6J5FW77_9BURK|nr:MULTISPECIES: TIGR01841 family phasin [Paraburkholderia]CAB3788604.1 hypothetical protein LMG28688_02721 [Paraburkholderia caffeinitolerans]